MCSTNLMQQGNVIDVFLARHVSDIYAHELQHTVFYTELGADNRMLQLNI